MKRLLLLMIVFLAASALQAPTRALAAGDLQRFLAKADLEMLVPGADELGPAERTPAVAPALANGKTVGYVFLNSDFVSSTGYSGRPIHVLVGLGPDGVVTGAQLVEHHEPIVLIGIPEKRIREVIDGYRGRSVIAFAQSDATQHDIDIVSGATVTIMVIDDSIMRAGIKVARRYGLGGLAPRVAASAGPRAVVDRSLRKAESWATLAGDGSVRILNLSVDQLNDAFSRSGDPAARDRPEPGDPNDVFINLSAALVSVPTIGLSLLGPHEEKNLVKKIGEDGHAILLMGHGIYSFRGSGFVRGGLFDRFQLVQGDNSFRFHDRNYKRLRKVAASGAPDFSEVALFTIPRPEDFDPAEPWRIELLVGRATGPTSKAFLTFDLGYRLPQRYLKKVATAPPAPVPQAAVPVEPRPSGPRRRCGSGCGRSSASR